MTIRSAVHADLDAILTVYASARRYMAAHGNPTQWGQTFPPRSLIEDDIRLHRNYVGVGADGLVHCVFALIPGADPTYAVIDGAWLNDRPYATIHRLASDGRERGVFTACLAFSRALAPNLRIDTHSDNLTMQRLIERSGFTRCGTIHVEDGTPRTAYQLTI